MKKNYLILEKGLVQKSIYPVEGSVTIGRSSENNIYLADQMVSRSHARIVFHNSTWIIEDLGSSNGIIFADERVARRKLQSGDTFQIGKTALRFVEEGVPDESERPLETLQKFAAAIKYPCPLVVTSNNRSWAKGLQKALQSTPIFKTLRDEEIRELAAVANLHLFSADQLTLQEGDRGRSIYIILDGRLKVFIMDYNSKEFELATLEANQFFGEMSLLTGAPHSASVVTLEPSLLIEIRHSIMRRLMLGQPKVMDILLKYSREREQDTKKKRAEADMEDRRGHPRLNEQLLVKFTVSPAETLPDEMINHTYEGTSSNISLTGLQLTVTGPATVAFCAGCELRMQIEFPPPWGRIRTLGIIRHVVHHEHTVQLGIEFFDSSEGNTKTLSHFIYGEPLITVENSDVA